MGARSIEEPMNPYTARLLGLLGTNEPLAVLEETPRRLADLRRRIGRDGLERPWNPGKWSARAFFSLSPVPESGLAFGCPRPSPRTIIGFNRSTRISGLGVTKPGMPIWRLRLRPLF